MKTFKLCNSNDMKVYFGKDGQFTAQHATATHLTVTEMASKTDGHGQKLYVDNIFSSPELFDDLAKYGFAVAVLSGQTEEACHKTAPKTTKMKSGDIRLGIRADLMQYCGWKRETHAC
jgi:hypothetical protein